MRYLSFWGGGESGWLPDRKLGSTGVPTLRVALKISESGGLLSCLTNMILTRPSPQKERRLPVMRWIGERIERVERVMEVG